MSDIILISKTGLCETTKCAICKNPNKTERGCDGACQYDKELHAKIVEAIEGIAEQRPQRPLGKWISVENDTYYGGGYWMCSKCSHRFSFGGFNLLNHYGICPNCGSPLKKEGGDS